MLEEAEVPARLPSRVRNANADRFLADMQRIIESSRAMQPLPGFTRTDVPGSLEWERARAWSQHGIPFSRQRLEELGELASELNVQPPWSA